MRTIAYQMNLARTLLLLTVWLLALLPILCVRAQDAGSQAAPPTAPRQESSWKTFSPPDGGFSILMPGDPVKSGQIVQTALGPLPHFIFSLHTQTIEYMVSYSDFPDSVTAEAEIRAAYDGARDQMKSIQPFKLAGEKDVTLDGRLGRDLIFESDGHVLKARLLIVNRRLFQALIMTPRSQQGPSTVSKADEATVNKFLDSFKVTDPRVTNRPEAAAATVDKGRIENSTYINDQFGLRLTFPASWTVRTEEENRAALEFGKEMMKGSDKSVNKALEGSVNTTTPLLTVSRFPISEASPRQAVFQVGVEKLSHPGLTSQGYAQSGKQLLLGAGLQFRLTRDVTTEMIGGRAFSVFELERATGQVTIRQKYYGRVEKGYALFFVALHLTAEDRLEVLKIERSITFANTGGPR